MKKIKEINLNPSYSLDSYPMHKRTGSHMGGPTMSADQAFSRINMQRVNKGYDIEEEESSEDEDILKEFSTNPVAAAIGDRASSVIKSGIFSIPVFGDILAFAKFLFTITKLRYESRKFAHKFSKLVEVELGDDIFEPEGNITSEAVLDKNLKKAVYRLENLNEYPHLDVTKKDIDKLNSQYFLMCKYVKDALIEFIGFADVAFGQKGFFLNFGISMVTFSSLPDFIVGQYAATIKSIYEKSEQTDSTLIDILKKTAAFFIKAPKELLNFLGNADLLLNVDKLSRLGMIHNMFQKYKGIDSHEEKATLGLDAIPGSPFDQWLEDNYADYSPEAYEKYSGKSETLDKISGMAPIAPKSAEFLTSIIDAPKETAMEAYNILMREDLSLKELYEDMEGDEEDEDSLEEYSAGGVAGGAIGLGLKVGNSSKTGGKPSIYTTADQENFLNFAKKTVGKRK